MSSPLDGRIRAIAREEVSSLLGDSAPATLAADANRVEALESAVTSLHGTILRIEGRLDALEKAAGISEHEPKPTVRRATRKDNAD
ncbi:hypothetical protein AB0E25_33545 [Streptomyces bobili]|uniref:hypothetical protein n=1 Tax=Streptomyces bobili TaxID=67280 RepID=UPI0033E880E6